MRLHTIPKNIERFLLRALLSFQNDPNFTFDEDRCVYRDSSGNIVEDIALNGIVEEVIEYWQGITDKLTNAHYQGFINQKVYRAGVHHALRRSGIQNLLLGVGGRERVTFSDYGFVGGHVSGSLRRLDGLIEEIAAGTVTLPQAQNRARMYVGDMRKAFHERRCTDVGEQYMIIERRHRRPAESCDDCIYYESLGWQRLGVLPAPTVDSACGNNCHCYKERRTIPVSEMEKWISTVPA